MAEYIDRKEAIEAICRDCGIEGDYHKCDGYSENSDWCDYMVSLRAVPAADVAPVRRGRWGQSSISTNGGLTRLLGYKCSVCGGFCVGESNYCPNCGAKMEVDNG